MTISEILQAIQNLKQPSVTSSDAGSTNEVEIEDIFDKKYNNENKKHRNWIAKFDHWYEEISHPFILVIIVIVIFIIFLIFRYLDIWI